MNDAKTALGHKIIAAKKAKSWTWPQIAEKLGYSTVWTTAACLGQMSMTPETAEKAAMLFDLSPAEADLLAQAPYRGSLPTAIPTDPLIYRFYELLGVYGTTWKGADPRGVRRRHHVRHRFRHDARPPAGPEGRPGPHQHERQVPAL